MGVLRRHYLANQAYEDYQHFLDAGAEAWQQLTSELLPSVCPCPYLKHEIKARLVSRIRHIPDIARQ